MQGKKLGIGLAIVVVALAGVGIVQALLFDQNVTPDAIFGGGNANGSYTVDLQSGIELGLRGKLRFNGANLPENTFNSNSDGTYSFAAGSPSPGFGFAPNDPGTPFWNFEWSVNTDQDGTTGLTLDDLTYELGMDFDPTLCTNYQIFDPITPNNVVDCWDHSIGTNATGNGGGTEESCPDAAGYATLLANNNVAQNSWSYQFFNTGAPWNAFLGSDDGTYDIYLRAYNAAGAVVAHTAIQIIVGQGGAVCDGACCTDGPGRESDCIIAGQNDCEGARGTYLGDHTTCDDVIDCVPLLVEMESMSAQMTPRGVLLRWTTTTEIDAVGFRLVRESAAPEKARTYISGTIPAAGNGLTGASYEFLDNHRKGAPNAVYFIEDVDIYGRVTSHGPITVRPMLRGTGAASKR